MLDMLHIGLLVSELHIYLPRILKENPEVLGSTIIENQSNERFYKINH